MASSGTMARLSMTEEDVSRDPLEASISIDLSGVLFSIEGRTGCVQINGSADAL